MSAFRLIQDNMIVASIDAPDADRARAEIDHYASVYAQDGSVMVQERVGKRWKAVYILAPKEPRP